MISRKNWFLVHRWLALIVSLQLLAWSVGGFVFSILDIDDVRGTTDRAESPPGLLRFDAVMLSPPEALSVAQSNNCGNAVVRIVLRERCGASVYEFHSSDRPVCAVDANSGAFLAMISKGDAQDVALADFKHDADVRSATLITKDPPGEYRGGFLPAYQVILNHPREPHIYVSAITGDVTARRNDKWRTFDFFWMLHIMDYGERENFNHWLLSAVSILAILTSLSGLALWWWRLPRMRSRSPQPQ